MRSALEKAEPSAKVDKMVEKQMKLNGRTILRPPEVSPDSNQDLRYPRLKRMISVNQTMCLVPNQSEALHVSYPPSLASSSSDLREKEDEEVNNIIQIHRDLRSSSDSVPNGSV